MKRRKRRAPADSQSGGSIKMRPQHFLGQRHPSAAVRTRRETYRLLSRRNLSGQSAAFVIPTRAVVTIGPRLAINRSRSGLAAT
jgi:hypothetical protein